MQEEKYLFSCHMQDKNLIKKTLERSRATNIFGLKHFVLKKIDPKIFLVEEIFAKTINFNVKQDKYTMDPS